MKARSIILSIAQNDPQLGAQERTWTQTYEETENSLGALARDAASIKLRNAALREIELRATDLSH